MPIPTDTFWNIRRLNWAFAISAVVLFLTTAWSIIQDYDRGWRIPQREARVWEAALTSDKIDRDLTPDKRAEIEQLRAEVARLEQELETENQQFRQVEAQIRQLDSRRETVEFTVNTLKSDVGVLAANLQDAITANDQRRVARIQQQLERPNARLVEDSERLAAINEQLAEAREKQKVLRADLDEKLREKTRLSGDADLLQRKLETLQPRGLLANVSDRVRNAPLMGFINPSERVQQVVLPHVQTDVAFMKITTIDRCATCHVNIQKNDFAEVNVLAYLEEQTATARGYKLPAKAGTRSADPVATAAAPGPVAMVDFWHSWARQVGPDIIRRNATRIRTVANTVGKTATVTYKGQPLASFAFDVNLIEAQPKADDKTPTTQPHLTDADAQSQILVALLQAWYRYEPVSGDAASAYRVEFDLGETKVVIENVERKAADAARNAAMRYAEELQKNLETSLKPNAYRSLRERYRWALVREVNLERRRQGRQQLDPSPVYLAHPRLDLYASQDSPHPMDFEDQGEKFGVGCTSCHDGSGQETDFVLAAHVPRPIWVDAKTGEVVLATQLVNPPSGHHAEDFSDMHATVFPHGSLVPQASSLYLATPHEDESHDSKPLDRDTLLSLPAPDKISPIDYIDPVTGLRGKALSQAEYWRRKYEPISAQSFYTTYHYWDWPMRQPQYIQANCVRCHTEVHDIREEAPVVYEGKQLFTNLGCVNCHQMDSIRPEPMSTHATNPKLVMANGRAKVGTDLRHVTSKLSPEFINTWIWAPKAFRPSTKMPHFFMLENNSSEEEIRRTRQEARAITEYLVRTATPLPPAHIVPPDGKGSAEAGKLLFQSIGCLACHQNLGDTTGEMRDGKPVTVAEKWITTDLTKQPKFVEQVAQKLGKAPQTADLATEARALYDAMTYNERQLYVQEHLAEPLSHSPRQPEATPALPKYPDGTPKPQFVQIGPELSGIGTKLTAARSAEQARQWLFDWLKEPRHYSDYTMMPRLRLTDQQALDLTEYLLAQTRQSIEPNDDWKATLSPIDRPKLIEMTAFFLRSRFSVMRAEEKADDPDELRTLAIDALTTETIDAEQAREIVRQIETEPDGRDTLRMVFLGEKLISHYGCMSCHAINGTSEMTSPCTNLSDWGQKGIDKLDFGYLDHHKVATLPPTSKIPIVNALSASATHLLDPRTTAGETASVDPAHAAAPGVIREVEAAWPHLEHNRVSWIVQKLRNSRAFDRGKVLLEPGTKVRENGLLEAPGKPYEKLKMPTFYLSEEQNHALVTFVISNRERLISAELTDSATDAEARLIAQGRELVERYNCVSCHQIENNVPQIQQYAKPEEITTKWPPSLRGEGNKVQHGWLFNFFKTVEPLRPLLVDGIRMPSFHATDDEWHAIIAYFNALSKNESQLLRRQLDPVIKAIPAAEHWPPDDWWTRREFADAARALREWGLANGQVRPIEFDPGSTADQLTRTYKSLLFKARFVEDLFDAPYPFVERGRADLSNLTAEQAHERLKRGEQLFYAMQCLSCHVLGDPSVEGAQKNPTAPNLSLTYERLQRRWVRAWVQEPAIIQVGTAMPPFLTGLPIFSLHGQAWPRSQQVVEAEAQRIEKIYGDDVEEQARLVLDFLYEAGAQGLTGVQPALVAQDGGQPATPSAPPMPSEPFERKETAADPGAVTQPAEGERPGPPTPEHPGAPVPVPSDLPDTPAKPQAEAAPSEPAPVPPQVETKPEEPKTEDPAPAPKVEGAPAITGKVVFKGDPPEMPEIDMSAVADCHRQHPSPFIDETVYVNENGTLRNVVVYISSGVPEGEHTPPSQPAVLDQKGCVYVPHVLAMQVGQKLVVKNSDPFLHNVHSLAQINPAFNFGQPNIDPGRAIDSIRAEERFKIKCDVHPWMGSFVVVLDHPFFSVTGDDGSFSIANLPAGDYTVTAWHESLGEQSAEVTVEAGKQATVELTFGS